MTDCSKLRKTETLSVCMWVITPGCAVSSRAGQARLDCNPGQNVSWSRRCGVLVDIQNNITSKSSSDRKYQNVFSHIIYCFALDGSQLVFSGCRKCGKLLEILEHFLLSWRATLTNQEGINESALIQLRKVIEKSWNFTSGPQWEPCSPCLLLFLIVFLVLYCISFIICHTRPIIVCMCCMFSTFSPNTISKPHHPLTPHISLLSHITISPRRSHSPDPRCRHCWREYVSMATVTKPTVA